MDALGDFFRFWWELLALNARKSFARARGLRPPCQAPGDSGRARETVCEACLQWNKAARFRRVCPLLVRTPAGWRCSVDAAAVRPFWGRAAAAYALLAAGLFLGGTLAAFGGLSAVGFRVSYRDVAWPPAWKNIDRARAVFYAEQGLAALAAGRINEAGIALGLATTLDPGNYGAGFALAQLWQAGQPALSDRTYRRLLATHPTQSAATARAWAQALLLRGDFRELAELATARLGAEAPETASWLHALVFSARRLGETATLRAARAIPGLAPETRALLAHEETSVGGDGDAVRRALTVPLEETAGDYPRYHQIEFLITQGDAARAAELLALYGAKLPANERVALTLRTLGALGARERRAAEFSALLAHNPGPALPALLAAELVRYPDPALLRLATETLAARPWATTPEAAAPLAALLCAAAAAGDLTMVEELRTRLRRATGGRLEVLDRIGDFFHVGRGAPALGHLLPSLPMLPPKTVYALHERPAR